ncbi:MAG: tetratricopeptide repeat protein [Pseudolabrys sp.]
MASTKGLRAFQNARARKKSAALGANPDAIFAQAIALHQAGRVGQAKILYQQILAVRPDHFPALQFLAVSEYQARNLVAAEALFGKAIQINPRSAEIYSNFSLVFYEGGQFEKAVEQCDKALALKPDYAEAHCNRGNALNSLERYEEAAAAGRRAIELKPDFAQAYDVLGSALFKLKQYDEALECYARALKLRPNYPEVYFNRATLLAEIKKNDQALQDYQKSLALNPEAIDARLGYAKSLLTAKRTWDAIAECERAIAKDPKSHEAYTLMGQCREATAEVDKAIACYDRALQLKPDFSGAIHNRIFVMDFVPGVTIAQHQEARRYWWEQIGAKLARPRHYSNSRDPKRRIVLGYVSADFRTHSAAFVFGPVLRHHDHSQFEVVCYSNSLDEDPMTREFKRHADRWRDVKGWTDDRLDSAIAEDGVDVLVDLSGHSAGHRLEVFARKPAPVQVTAWGNATGSGIPTIDYLFSDEVLIPESIRSQFAETVWNLPCSLTLDPPERPPVQEPPLLTKGYVTYGVFNRIVKISDAALDVWCALLQEDRTARIVVKHHALGDEIVRKIMFDKFARRGIAAERIDLVDRSERQHHLAALANIDISLDPFPQNGGVSTWESLHLGVPVVAHCGETIANRMSAAILTAIGYEEWIAKSNDDYIRIALDLARQPERLKALRSELPARIAASEAGNPVAYTRAVEAAYRTFWARYCAKA